MTTIPDTDSPQIDPSIPTWVLGETPWQAIQPAAGPRARVIIDNDFSGDPDDLFQLVHHVLSPSVDIRAVVASHLRPGDGFDPSSHTADNAATVVKDVFARMGIDSADVIYTGANEALVDRKTPQRSPAVDAIIAEALRDDVASPLFYVAGGGLTDIASAYLIEPRIADRLTLVWIGGGEHEELAAPPPGAMPIEYNLLIDVVAGQVIFGDSSVKIWQVPRDVYRQCLVSDAELRLRVAATGPLGRYLYDEVARVFAMVGAHMSGASETYALGDSPLVLLTALQSLFEPDSASSQHVERSTPALDDDGGYVEVPGARSMRIYTWVDTRLMFEDFYLKLSEFGRWQAGSAA
ncbi:inosine-uridine nucleoside N-ribohydrolase [Microbacterium endophyticum]|uniref:Inosine-uridine nucleoside N-ribohydrolase n=1 Tax=Microbacterium endophyticum TaxID=1526412 RepID=A0A7W4V451_9MICO|nr:nucleoside hydrolase [Microbacterium endophyticum]MBB2975843.1 inosine-uridine nucleoside N-ribohydrolase [Microbacterium endophyticum]NIK36326.1 inosine-uridine nucleoside N-ribohydrolase [Microbacterium endophyticum]